MNVPSSTVEKAIAKLREARLALAESYLDRAAKAYRGGETPARLAAWRIAAARLVLERGFPGEK